ncbi:MAG: metallophosphoesterase [Chloroflexi bacterium]|nr:metallophosphoesterase [Chloroflexota bacterium]
MKKHPDENENRTVSRRDFLKLGGLVGATSLLTACGVNATQTMNATEEPTSTSTPTPDPQPVLRFAHISDMHIQTSYQSQRLARALRNIQLLTPSVDFIFNAGDCIMDSLYATKDEALEQWGLFHAGLPADFPIPVHHVIGNHDVWGWGLNPERQAEYLNDPLFGKGLALQQLGLTNRYYSFDRNGWHFIVLDSIHPAIVDSEHPYTGKLDDEQFAWLKQELETVPPSTPILVVSHIPILCACELLDGNNEASGNWNMPGAWMHIDARKFWELFWDHPNVKLCLSGHAHQVEDLRYHGVRYVNNGSICGNWWNGSYMDCPPGYMLYDLYADSSANCEYIIY